MDDECKHGLLIGTCTLCKPKPKGDDTVLIYATGPVFTAQFPGFCYECHEPIEVDQSICMSDGSYVHEDCAK